MAVSLGLSWASLFDDDEGRGAGEVVRGGGDFARGLGEAARMSERRGFAAAAVNDCVGDEGNDPGITSAVKAGEVGFSTLASNLGALIVSNPPKASSNEEVTLLVPSATGAVKEGMAGGGANDAGADVPNRLSKSFFGVMPVGGAARGTTGCCGCELEEKSKVSSKLVSKEKLTGVAEVEFPSFPMAASNSSTPATGTLSCTCLTIEVAAGCLKGDAG